jgi:hypothetical protein
LQNELGTFDGSGPKGLANTKRAPYADVPENASVLVQLVSPADGSSMLKLLV